MQLTLESCLNHICWWVEQKVPNDDRPPLTRLLSSVCDYPQGRLLAISLLVPHTVSAASILSLFLPCAPSTTRQGEEGWLSVHHHLRDLMRIWSFKTQIICTQTCNSFCWWLHFCVYHVYCTQFCNETTKSGSSLWDIIKCIKDIL